MNQNENCSLMGFAVSEFSLGCWPIAGVTSVHVNKFDSLATIQAALDCGINFFDTAYGYGAFGQSECLLGEVLRNKRQDLCVATKCGMELLEDGQKIFDCRPKTIVRQCEESLKRLGRDSIDLLYLHAYDGKTPIEEVAACFDKLAETGKIKKVGVSNLELELLDRFHRVCPISVVQDYFNALQQDDRKGIRDWCQRESNPGWKIHFAAYWPLMKGLLAGELKRDHVFHEKDSRKNYPMFQGRQWQANQDFLDEVRVIANDCQTTVAGIVLAWTKTQVDFVLFGAKRPIQVLQNVMDSRSCRSVQAIEDFEKALARRFSVISTDPA